MPNFYLPDLPPPGAPMILRGQEASHAAQVLRLQRGDEVTLLNGKGTRVLARVSTVNNHEVTLDSLQVDPWIRPVVEVVLFQAVSKPKSMEWIAQKATELGVHTIQPVITQRVVSRMAGKEANKKVEKWKRIAIESLKQCGSPWLPCIEQPSPLSQMLPKATSLHYSFIASLAPGAKMLREWVQELEPKSASSSPARVGIWIGPEGDFSEEETSAIIAAGAKPITLGKNTLRSETASICALALVQYELTLSTR